MALFSLSPAVTTIERDNTLTAELTGDYIGGLAGVFNWGPVSEPKLITGGEVELEKVFGAPSNATYSAFMVAADFFSYTPKGWILREVGANARNAVPVGATAVLVKNEDAAEAANLAGLDFIAKFPGSRGNGLSVEICDYLSFPTWEFQGAFDYKPKSGEFAIAVVDGSGVWTGAGAANQKEKLIVSGSAVGGTRQIQTLTQTGTAAGGVKQVEQLVFAGTSTGTSITVDGVAVTVVNGDSANKVATKVAAALAAIGGTYESAVSVLNKVVVTYAVPIQRTKIADVNSIGITAASTILTLGNANFNITVYGETVELVNGDVATVVTDKIYAVFSALTAKYMTVTKPTTTSVRWTFVDYGAKTILASQTLNGVTIATVVGTPGTSAIALTIFGQTVNVLHNDTSSQVATKIATALNAMGSPIFSGVFADKNSVDYSLLTVGIQTAQTAPAAQNALTFEVDVTSPGRKGTILEKYEAQTTNPAAKFADGTSQYFADAMKSSIYVHVGDKTTPLSTRSVELAGGVDDNASVDLTNAYKVLGNSEQYQINYLIGGAIAPSVQKIVIDVADTRKDCIAFNSPEFNNVVNNKGSEMEAVLEWRTINVNRESSYAFNDDNWALVYDRYNDVNRWIPTCGGTAGLKARTDREQNPWDSPAGHENGRYKNYIKLAWSASKPQRDELYKVSVNSVVSFPGEGILLYGDKMSLSRPSAFQHINVRSAFIVAEVSIAKLAKYFLFKNNTEYTRSQFLNAVRPLIRNMVGAGAFESGIVIADGSNNTADVKRANQMVGTIKLVPNYSINNVVLYFEATAAGVSFDEQERV